MTRGLALVSVEAVPRGCSDSDANTYITQRLFNGVLTKDEPRIDYFVLNSNQKRVADLSLGWNNQRWNELECIYPKPKVGLAAGWPQPPPNPVRWAALTGAPRSSEYEREVTCDCSADK